MAFHALGDIAPSSTTTGLRATANLVDPVARFSCQAVQFQALGSNAGSVRICSQETPDLTKHVLMEIGPGGLWSIGDPSQRAGFNAADFWILPATAGEGVRVTVVR